jgi:hypothetical protein
MVTQHVKQKHEYQHRCICLDSHYRHTSVHMTFVMKIAIVVQTDVKT